MCLVAAGREHIAAALGGALDADVEVAAFNAPELTVLSGSTRAIDAATTALVARGTFVRDVRVDVASHSRLVDVLAHELRRELADLAAAHGELEMFSTVTAARLNGASLDADYWFRNLRQPVRFAEVVAALAAEAPTVFVEISPHPVLCKCIDACKSGAADGSVRSVATALRDASELGSVGEALGRLYELGRDLDWSALAPAAARLGPRPAYAWDRKAYWLQRSAHTAEPSAGPGAHPLLGVHVESSLREGEHVWESVLGEAAQASFGEHTVDQRPVLPAVAHLELVASAYRELYPGAAPALEQVEVARPLSLARTGARLQLVLRPDPELPHGVLRFVVSARHGDAPWQVQCTGSVGSAPAAPASAPAEPARPAREWSSEAYYETLAAWHLTYGSTYRTLARVVADGGGAWGRLRDARSGAHLVDPAVLDGALQLALACAETASVGADEVIVPVGFDRVGLWPERGARAGLLTAVARARADAELGFDVWLSRDGQVVAEFEGVRCRRAARALFLASMSRSRDELALRVRWLEQPSLPPLCTTPRRVAVYADDTELAERLSLRLEEAGAQVERRPLAAEPEHAPARPGALEPELIVVVCPEADPGRRDELLVLELAQRFARADAARPPQLCVVVPYALGVLPSAASDATPPAPEGGGVWGLMRTLRAESPRLSPRIIAALDPQAARLEVALVRELLHARPAPEVLLASGARFTPRLCPLEVLAGAPRERGFDADGIHLLVGGAGGIGTAVVARLLAGGARRFAVVGRSGAEEPRVAALTRQVEAAGGVLAYLQADASTPDGGARLAAWLRSQQRRVAGVMLLTGQLDDAPFESLSAERYLRQHASKAILAQQLDALVGDSRLDYFVLFSSLSGVLGSAGQAHYAAANSALDAFAARRLAQGRRALSIAWGPWGEVGMVADDAHRRALGERGITPLATAEAVELLVGLLASGVEGQVTVAALDRTRAARTSTSPLLTHDAAPREVSGLAPAATPPALPEGGDLDELRGWIGKHLGHALRSPVGPRDYERPFNSLGLQSLQLLQLKIKLEGQLGIFLSASSIWKQPTVTGLASLIQTKLQRRAP
jgi:myxalamid-type polyketide synthase MxaE and MxaD